MTTFDPQQMSFSERQVEALSYIEQVYMIEQQIPSAEKLADVFGVTKETTKKWLESDKFKYVLESKGILVTRKSSEILTSQQLTIAEMLLNISDRRSVREKCQEAGIKIAKLNAWYRDPAFSNYMESRAKQLFEGADAKAYLSLVKNIDNGDLRATQFYFELSGKYKPRSRDEVNLDSFLVTIIEILQARIRDPGILNQIAQDIENLMSGKPVELHPVPVAISAASVEQIIPEVIDTEPVFKLDMGGIDGDG